MKTWVSAPAGTLQVAKCLKTMSEEERKVALRQRSELLKK